MMDKVYCPWCGREMKLEESLPFSGVFAYVCECGAVSPNENGAEEALKAALKRPLQKPLTLEEAFEETAVWLEFASMMLSVENRIVPVLFSSYCKSDNACFFDDGKDDIPYMEDDREYNSRWRCWAMKPTDEERKAAKWDEYCPNCGAKMDVEVEE